MQAVQLHAELLNSIDLLEKALNGKDSEFILEAVREYKECKTINTEALNIINSKC